MRVPPNVPQDVQQAFRDLWTAIDALTSGNLDFGGRRIVNAGDAKNDADYITRRQLLGATGQTGGPLIVDVATVRKVLTVLGTLKLQYAGLLSNVPGVVTIVRGDGVTLATIKADKVIGVTEVDAKKFALDPSVIQTYTTTNVTTLRGGDFAAMVAADVRSTLGSLIVDLRAAGLIA